MGVPRRIKLRISLNHPQSRITLIFDHLERNPERTSLVLSNESRVIDGNEREADQLALITKTETLSPPSFDYLLQLIRLSYTIIPSPSDIAETSILRFNSTLLSQNRNVKREARRRDITRKKERRKGTEERAVRSAASGTQTDT